MTTNQNFSPVAVEGLDCVDNTILTVCQMLRGEYKKVFWDAWRVCYKPCSRIGEGFCYFPKRITENGKRIYGIDFRPLGRFEAIKSRKLLQQQLDKNGMVVIVGRKKRFVKVCGRRMNLDDVEGYLSEKLAEQICCVAVEDRLVVVYERNAQDIAFENLLKDLINQKYKMPLREVVLRHLLAMPHLASRKVNYGEITEACMKDFLG